MKWSFLVTICMIIGIASKAQTGLYRTYEDYENHKLEPVNEISYLLYSGGRYRLHYIDSAGKKQKLKPTDVWGFIYEGNLFRTETQTEGFVRVLVEGKLVYYENGYIHLQALTEKKNEVLVNSLGDSRAVISYLSSDLKSEIIGIPSSFISMYKMRYKQFQEEHPEQADFFECLKGGKNYLTARACAASLKTK